MYAYTERSTRTHTHTHSHILFVLFLWRGWNDTTSISAACRRLTLDPCFSPCTRINSKWIKDLNIRPETLKQLQKAVGNALEQIGIGTDFLNRTQKAQYLREAMNTWDCIKLKSFCTAKETVTRLKTETTE
jgi:hypothetical protein